MTKGRVAKLPDGSACFVVDIDTSAEPDNPIKWNPGNKVVQDHRDGTVDVTLTNIERAKRNLPIPWTPEMGEAEVRLPDIP